MTWVKHPVAVVIWTLIRLWLGWQWLTAGWGKVTGPESAAWIGHKAPAAILGFVKGALAKTAGPHPAVQGWYASFLKSVVLPNAKIFSYMVAFGEVLVGLGLIFGFLTTIALLAGAFMNLNYMLAGTVSTNPILYTVAVILLFVGPAAYLIGLDRFMPWGRQHIKDGWL